MRTPSITSVVFLLMAQSNNKDLDHLQEQFGSADLFPVVTRIPADLLTPLGAYYSVAGNGANSFLFESVEGGQHVARYSFIGGSPIGTIEGGRGSDRDLLVSLRNELRPRKLAVVDNLPTFTGGAVGYLDFSLVDEIEPVLKEEAGPPSRQGSQFSIFRDVIAFDHAMQTISLISLVLAEEASGDPVRFRRLLEEAEKRTLRTADLLETARRPIRAVASETGKHPDFESNFTVQRFKAAVNEIKGLILAGECYQVVLSQRFERETNASPISIYRALRSLNPSPYMFLMRFGARSIIGASPEMLVRCREGVLEYRPIAGTRPRGETADKDEALAREMADDEKERAEHTMLVDLGRNDLGRVSKFGSVKVNGLMATEKYSHVQHLVTSLTAELREGLDCFDALLACFPAGTVSGAPKIRALQIIKQLEPLERGVYSGAVGYLDYAGNLDTCIAIRTIVLDGNKVRIQAGAGIVADSDPQKEYEETIHKANGLFTAVELAESGRFGL